MEAYYWIAPVGKWFVVYCEYDKQVAVAFKSENEAKAILWCVDMGYWKPEPQRHYPMPN